MLLFVARLFVFEIESVLFQKPNRQMPLVARFGFFVDVSIRTLHCSFWFFVGTKTSNKRQKSLNGNQALLS